MFDEGRVIDGYSFHLGDPSTVTLDLPYDFSVLELDNAAGKSIDPARFRDAVVKAVPGGSLERDLAIDGESAPGREFVVKFETTGMPAAHGLLVRVIPDGDAMWVLTVMVPLTELDGPDVHHFVDSFELTP